MLMRSQQDDFPYATYRDYIAALSENDNAYRRLSHFLTPSPDSRIGSHVHKDTQVPRSGSVTVIDQVDGRLKFQEFQIGVAAPKSDVPDCILSLDNRPDTSETRIVLLSYHRDPRTGEYTGVDTDVLDAVGKKYKVHPEVLMWHYGSDYGLDSRFFLYTKPPIPSALSHRAFCQLQNRHSLIACCVHPSNTVIIFARNYEYPNWDLLTSRLVFLDSSLPTPLPAGQSMSRWSNTLFIEALRRMIADEMPAIAQNPIEYIIPYAQMVLVNENFIMDMWAMKVMHPQGKTSSNLEVHYDKQLGMLNEMRQNLSALRTFTTNKSSSRWQNMIADYERLLLSTEQQINVVLAQKMTYRAAMTSLDESRVGIEHAKRSMEQNDRLKRLTQLAFVFIPLSFSTSIFGMNLELLGTGNGKAWMVIIAIMLAYIVTCLIWLVIDYENIKKAWVAGKADLWPPRRNPRFDEGARLDAPRP